MPLTYLQHSRRCYLGYCSEIPWPWKEPSQVFTLSVPAKLDTSQLSNAARGISFSLQKMLRLSEKQKIFRLGPVIPRVRLTILSQYWLVIFFSFCHIKTVLLESMYIFLKLQITAFVLLRNIPGSLRSKFSRFYAWVGSFSLEVSNV